MVIEEIQNKAYKTSGKMKAAQKRAVADARRAQSQNNAANISDLLSGGGSSRSFGATTNYTSGGKSGGGSKSSSNSGGGSSRSFGATVGYAAQEGTKFAGYEEDQKAELLMMQNFDIEDPTLAVDQMEAVADLNQTIIQDKCRHFVISFHEEDEPTKEQMQEVVADYLKQSGYGEHQAIAYIHHDKPHKHIHVVANYIHPVSHKPVERSFHVGKQNYKTNELVARRFEVKYDFKKVQGKHFQHHDNDIKPTTREQKREMSTHSRDKISSKSMRSEQFNGVPSFERWAKESKECKIMNKELRDTLSKPDVKWADVHRVLDKYNLEIRPGKNNGYVVVDKSDDKTAIKASSVAPELSGPKLNRALKNQEYVAPAHMLQGDKNKGYVAEVNRQQGSNKTYEMYKSQKQAYRGAITHLNKKYGNRSAQMKAIDRRADIKIRQVQRDGQIKSREFASGKIYENLGKRDESKSFNLGIVQRDVYRGATVTTIAGKSFVSRIDVNKQIEAIRSEAAAEKKVLSADYDREKKEIDQRFDSCKGSYKDFLEKEVSKGNEVVKVELDRVNSRKVEVDSPEKQKTPEKQQQDRQQDQDQGVKINSSVEPPKNSRDRGEIEMDM